MKTPQSEDLEQLQAHETMIRQLQHRARTSRSYTEFEAQYGINIRNRSRINATRVIIQLDAGEKFIEKHRQNPETDSVLLLTEQNGGLSAEEQTLVDFVVDNLSLKHASNAADEITSSGAIIAVKQLSLSNDDLFRNTSAQSATDNNVFFTLGVGDHPITPFLDKAKMVVSVDIPKMRKTNPLALSGLWVSPHLTEYQNSRQSPTAVLGDTTYYYTHSWKDLSKTYVYQRGSGAVYQRTVKFADEVYASQELDQAIAHEIVLHLRFIGGSYRQHLLATVCDQALSQDKKLKIISTAMTAIMPGWIFPEAKVPVKFSINDEAVSVKHLKQFSVHDIDKKLRRMPDNSIEDRAVADLLAEFAQKKPDYAPSPIVQALNITPSCLNAVSTMLDAGFNINGHGEARGRNYIPESISALHLAFKRRDLALCQFLFSAQTTHPLDKKVKFGILPPDMHDLSFLLADEDKPQPNSLGQFFAGQQQSLVDDRDLLSLYVALRQKFPVIDNCSIISLLKAIGSGYQNLAIYLLDNVATEHFIAPNLALKLKPKQLLITGMHSAASKGMIGVVQRMVDKKLTRIDDLIPSGHVTVSGEADPMTGEADSHTSHFSGGGTCLHSYIESNEDLTQIPTLIKMGIYHTVRDGNGETAYSLISAKIEGLRSDKDYQECREALEHYDLQIKKFCSERRISLVEVKMNGDYDRGKANLQAAIKSHEDRILHLTTQLDYLKELDAETKSEKNPTELCSHRHSTVAAIIMGRTPSGETIVVLGEKRLEKKRYDDESPKPVETIELMFPGGLKDTFDADHYAAMIKEVREETGLDLSGPTLKPTITRHTTYHKLGAGNHAYYHHEVYLIDLGEALYHARLYARDDLCRLHKVPVSLLQHNVEANPQQGCQLRLRGQSFFVRHSNAVSIQTLCAPHLPKTLALEGVLDLEFDGYYMACDAAARGDIAALERLKAYGAPLQPSYKQSHYVNTTPIREAVLNGKIACIQWFVENNLEMDYLGKLNIYTAAVKCNRLESLAYLCENQIGFPQMWSAICNAEKENKLDCLRLMLNYLVLFLDTKKSSNEEDSLHSLKNCYHFGLKAAINQGWKDIAMQLILDGRIDGHEIVSYGEEGAYNLCLKQGWFDLIFQLAMNELQHYLTKQGREMDITLLKVGVGYAIKCSAAGGFVNIHCFDKELGKWVSGHERLFNLLVLANLSGYGPKKHSQSSSLTHFKPGYAALADFTYQCCLSQSPGHEIALALLEKIAREKNDPACQAVLTKLQSSNASDSLGDTVTNDRFF